MACLCVAVCDDESSVPVLSSRISRISVVTPKRRWIWALLAACTCAWHFRETLALFPSRAALVDDRPVISVDHAIHLYHGYLGARFLARHGTSWGYDPFFMAGYPKTPVYDSSSGPAELFELAAGARYSPRAYKIGITALVALVPLVVVAAARAAGVAPAGATAALVWTVAYWWVGFPAMLVRTGLVAFVWASALAVLAVALLVRFGTRPSRLGGLALAAVLALGIQAHATFALLVFGPAAVCYAVALARRSWRWHVAFGGVVAAALAVTWFWWWPLLRFLPMKTPSVLFMKDERWGFVWDYYWLADARIPLLLVLFGGIGLAQAWRSGARLCVAAIGMLILVLSALTFAGSMWRPTLHLEPLRFQVPLALAWCIPAGQGLVTALAWWDVRPVGWSRRTARACLRLAVLVLLVCAVTRPPRWWWRPAPPMAVASTWRVALGRLRDARPLAVGLRPEMLELVAWIRAHTDSSARILLEDQLRLWESSEAESLHWTPLLPLLTDREFLGGLYHLAFIPHHRAELGDWQLGGRRIWEWSDEELRAFCERYNIGWVITWSRASPWKGEPGPLASDRFDELPFCERIATLPRHSTRPDENAYFVFRVRRDRSYFERGTGRVVARDYNRIELGDLVPDDGQIVLRYHWQSGFVSDPPLALEPADEPGDPVGFVRIRLDRPLPELRVWNGYR